MGTEEKPQQLHNGDRITDYAVAVTLPDRTILVGCGDRLWVLNPARPPRPRALHAGAGLDPIPLDGTDAAATQFNEAGPFEILHVPPCDTERR